MITEQRVHALIDLIDSSWSHSFVTTYIGWCYNRTDAPMVYALGNALGLLSANAHPDLCVYLGGKVHATTWIMVVGPSGYSRKTTSLDLAAEVQQLVDPSRIGSEPGSVEGLVESLAQDPQQRVHYGEFGAFLSKSAGTGYFRPMREKYTELYDCTPIKKTYSKHTLVVENPRLSLGVAVTASYLERWTTQTDWEGGFMGRFCVLASTPERYLPMPSRRPAIRDWIVWRLQCVQATAGCVCVGLEPDAYVLWVQWSEAIRKLSLAAPDRWVAAASARTQTIAAKVAILFALDAGIDVSRPWKVPLHVLRAAILFAEMHFDSLGWVVRELCGTRFERERRNVMRAIESHAAETITLGGILLHTTPPMEKRDVLRVLETLVEERTVYRRSFGGALCWSLLPPKENEMAKM